MKQPAIPQHGPGHVWHRAKLSPHTRLLLARVHPGAVLHWHTTHGAPFHFPAHDGWGSAAPRRNSGPPLHTPCHDEPSCVAGDLGIIAVTVGVLSVVAYLCNLVGGLHPH
jgi:hypothetical protein